MLSKRTKFENPQREATHVEWRCVGFCSRAVVKRHVPSASWTSPSFSGANGHGTEGCLWIADSSMAGRQKG